MSLGPYLTNARIPVLLVLLVLVLLAVGVVLLLRPRPRTASEPPACTQTITPQSGSVASWLASAQPGQVLCLAPGTYAEGITVGSAQGGTESQPLWIRAQTEGTVLIDGLFGQRPLDCLGRDTVIWGLNLKDGNDSTLVLRGTRCAAKRIVAWSTASTGGIDNVVDLGGTQNLLEDVAAFGFARKMLAAGARGGRSGNVLRRVWAEHNGFIQTNPDSGRPTNPLEVGYDQDLVTVENALLRRNILTNATEPEAPLAVFSTFDSWMGGVLAYVQPGDRYDTTVLGSFAPDGGSHAGSGHTTRNTILTQTVFYAPPSFPNVSAFWMVGAGGATGNRMDTVVAVTPIVSTCGAEGWTCTNVKQGTTMQEALGAQSVWEGVPGLCKRLVGRQLTETPLWPWPMEQRISAALVAAGRPAYSVTASVEATLGPLPAACKTGAAPGPGPDTTPPQVSVTAPRQDQVLTLPLVSVSATASDNVAVAGVQFVLDGQPFQGEDQAAPYTLTWQTQAVAPGSHTMAARARDQAGNQTTSAVVTFQVQPEHPPDPTPPLTSLACTGTLTAVPGPVQLTCVPEPGGSR